MSFPLVDDFVDIELLQFEQKLFVFDSCGNIQALCLKPFGKSDAGWIHLFLWNDEECPEFCPVSILLCYVHCAGIKGGFLFPSEEELKTPPDNGVFVTQLSYSIAMSRMNKIAKQVLGLVNYKVGMHTFRRTGYLFGRWGGGTIELLAKSARHISLKTAMLYVEDADAQRELTHIHNNHLNKVRTFKPISVKTTTNALQLNMPSFEFQADLPEIAGRYVYKHLLVPKSHQSSKCPSNLCACFEICLTSQC